MTPASDFGSSRRPIVPGGTIFVLGENDPAIAEIQALLGKYGYDIPTSGNFDGPTRDVDRGVPAAFPSRPGGRGRRHLDHRDHQGRCIAARAAQSD